MRNISKFAVSLALLATQVNVPQINFGNVAAAAKTPSVGAAGVYEVKLNIASAEPIQIAAAPKPDYDAQVLVPLHAAQAVVAAQTAAAQAAAAAAARQRALAQVKTAVVRTAALVIPSGDIWERLRLCEAGGDYTRNSGNGYYGAYQYSLSTWGGYMGYTWPDQAPPAVQDAKARATQAARGWSPWPSCSRKLGL